MQPIPAIFLICLVGCARSEIQTPDLQTYVSRFEDTYKVYTGDIAVKFGTTTGANGGGTPIGDCDLGGFQGNPTVTINKDYWDGFSDSRKEQLMFHELGHCYFYRTHTSGKLTDGCPTSIMDPFQFSEDCYKKNQAYYIKELRDNSSRK